MARGVWGVDIRSLDTGEALYQLNDGRLMMPASNMKIVTLAGAVDVFGWDHTFSTTLETTAPIENGSLKGDLIVRGGGDPTINTRNNRAAAVLDEWAGALRAAGIARVEGRIVGDDQLFDDEGIGPGWAWDYLQYGYAAPVKGVVPPGRYMGYEATAVEIAKFFKTRKPPVSAEETTELFAFMEAAQESKRRGGAPVKLREVLDRAARGAD